MLDNVNISVNVLPQFSDHNMILVEMELQDIIAKTSNQVSKLKLNFNKADSDQISPQFEQLHNNFKNNNMSTVQMWNNFTQVINTSTTKIPTLLSRPKGQPWITRQLIRLIRKGDRIHRTPSQLKQPNQRN